MTTLKLIPRLALGALAAATLTTAASAADRINVAIGQKGLWNSMVTVQCMHWGICEKAGLDVHITWTAGGSATLQAAVSGSTDLALTNGTLGVLAAYSRGAPIRIVSAETTGSRDTFWYVLADSKYKTMADTNGASIGFSRPGSSTNLAELALAKQFKVDLKLIPTGGLPATRTQVLSHQVDIGWSVPPNNLDLVHQGKIRIIARGVDVPALQQETVRVNVANLNFLKAHRDVAKRFIQAYQDTIDWIYANQDKSLKLFADENKIDMATAKETLNYFPKEALNPAHLIGLDRVNQEAVDQKKIDKPLTDAQLKDVVDMLTK
jgi:NitT/TauT family transport system substrate-binding protein